jgi:hypothetical protein
MNNSENSNTNVPPKWRAWLHIGMGIVYLLCAPVVYSAKTFATIKLSTTAVYGMSGLLVIYGAFRLWRGVTDLKIIKAQ